MNQIFRKPILKILCLCLGLITGYLMYLMTKYPDHENGILFWIGAILTMYSSIMLGLLGFSKKN